MQIQWMLAILVVLIGFCAASSCLDDIAQIRCPKGSTETLIVQLPDSRLEEKCLEMRRNACCLTESTRLPFSTGARTYQTWTCPPQAPFQGRKRVVDEQVEPEQIFRHQAVPWNLDRIDTRPNLRDGMYMPLSLSNVSAGPVHVYIFDTGIYAAHQSFANTQVSLDYPDPAGAIDCNGHGTHVASIVASVQNGVIGEAVNAVVLHAIRVLDCSGAGTTTSVISGIGWAINNLQRPAIFHASLGGGKSAVLDDVVNTVRADMGILFVVAAGNEATDACTRSPAGASGSIAVGATRITDDRASYSNYGSCVNIFAPGSDVLAAGIDSPSQIIARSGTSMAAPHVTGAIARLALTNATIRAQVDAGVWDDVMRRATVGVVLNPGPGSPNLFLFVGDVTKPPPPSNLAPPMGPGLPSDSATITEVTGLFYSLYYYMFLIGLLNFF